jgi:hypothetical protein
MAEDGEEKESGFTPKTAAGRELKARAEARKAKAEAGKRKVWCAYTADVGGTPPVFVLFGTELAALRYAAEHTMHCKPVEFGVPLGEQVQ